MEMIQVLSLILNNLLPVAILVIAAVVLWKVSKTVIHLIIGLIIIGLICWGVYEVYKVGLPIAEEGAGYAVVFTHGLLTLLGNLIDKLF